VLLLRPRYTLAPWIVLHVADRSFAQHPALVKHGDEAGEVAARRVHIVLDDHPSVLAPSVGITTRPCGDARSCSFRGDRLIGKAMLVLHQEHADLSHARCPWRATAAGRWARSLSPFFRRGVMWASTLVGAAVGIACGCGSRREIQVVDHTQLFRRRKRSGRWASDARRTMSNSVTDELDAGTGHRVEFAPLKRTLPPAVLVNPVTTVDERVLPHRFSARSGSATRLVHGQVEHRRWRESVERRLRARAPRGSVLSMPRPRCWPVGAKGSIDARQSKRARSCGQARAHGIAQCLRGHEERDIITMDEQCGLGIKPSRWIALRRSSWPVDDHRSGRGRPRRSSPDHRPEPQMTISIEARRRVAGRDDTTTGTKSARRQSAISAERRTTSYLAGSLPQENARIFTISDGDEKASIPTAYQLTRDQSRRRPRRGNVINVQHFAVACVCAD